jgi:hypothetical protein
MVLVCDKCGFEDPSGFLERRRERKQSILCQSCLAKPVRSVKTEFGLCRPHRGKFGDDDTPLDRWGRPFRPGYRLCHRKDCIEVTHIAIDPEGETSE